jgi:excinuclease UvrABC nuclease subunit
LPKRKTKIANDLAMNIEARGHRQTILLWPRIWQKCNPPIKLAWKRKTFTPHSAAQIPTAPGVYAFIVQPGVPPGLPFAVLMYIGMTHSLRERFRAYLREMDDPSGRPAILTMLNMYQGYIYFYCASVPKPTKPEVVENHLIETLAPPMNKQYPATIRRIIGAFS